MSSETLDKRILQFLTVLSIMVFFLSSLQMCSKKGNFNSLSNISKSDSLKVSKTYKTFFKLVEENNISELQEMSTDSIYCILCFKYPNNSSKPYHLEKSNFFENHLSTIKNSHSRPKVLKNRQ